jgi:hypothetical protein
MFSTPKCVSCAGSGNMLYSWATVDLLLRCHQRSALPFAPLCATLGFVHPRHFAATSACPGILHDSKRGVAAPLHLQRSLNHLRTHRVDKFDSSHVEAMPDKESIAPRNDLPSTAEEADVKFSFKTVSAFLAACFVLFAVIFNLGGTGIYLFSIGLGLKNTQDIIWLANVGQIAISVCKPFFRKGCDAYARAVGPTLSLAADLYGRKNLILGCLALGWIGEVVAATSNSVCQLRIVKANLTPTSRWQSASAARLSHRWHSFASLFASLCQFRTLLKPM